MTFKYSIFTNYILYHIHSEHYFGGFHVMTFQDSGGYTLDAHSPSKHGSTEEGWIL
jgi:hypothetical protein